MKHDESRKKKKRTIFIFFLIPLIVIMLIQSAITIGTLVVRRTAKTLEAYSGGMMRRLVENRQVILQNDMNQRWSAISDQEGFLNNRLERFLADEGSELEEVLLSDERKDRLLEEMFPECLDILQNNSTTGVFLILTGRDMEQAGVHAGFFIRDSDPHTNPVNYTDLLLERGNKQLSRAWNVPLDTNWTTAFPWTEAAGIRRILISTNRGVPGRHTRRPIRRIWDTGLFLFPWKRAVRTPMR